MILEKIVFAGAMAAALTISSSLNPSHEEETDSPVVVQTVREKPKAKPIPAGPEAKTKKMFEEQFLPFYRRVIVDPFRNSSDAQQEWAGEALALLEEEAKLNADFDTESTGCVVRKKAERFVKLGAEYPVFKYMWGRTLFLRNKKSEARPLLNEVFERARTDKTLPSVLRIQLMTGKCAQERDDLSPEDRKAVCETLIEAFTDPAYADVDWTYVAFLYLENSKCKKSVELMPLLEKAEKTGGVEVRVLSLCQSADVAIKQAWSARGSGYANTVRPEGWEKFGTGIEYAKDCYERAWQIRQDLPFVASGGLCTAMGDKREARKWFDRVVSAQLDFRPAYQTYIFYALYPRWCGSLEEMKEFGEECLATGRFDTDVPLFYVETMFRIAKELEGDWAEAFKDSKDFDTCTNVLTRYMPPDNAPTNPKTIWKRWSCASGLSALSTLSGDYQTIRRVNKYLREMSGSGQESIDGDYFPAGVPARDVLNRVYAFAGPDGERLGELCALMKSGLYPDAEKLLEEIYVRKKINSSGLDIVCTFDLQLAIERSRKTGEWFDMIPVRSPLHGCGPYLSYDFTVSCTNQVFWCSGKEGHNGYSVPIPHSIEYSFKVRPLSTTGSASVGLGLDTFFGCMRVRPLLFFERGSGKENARWKVSWLMRNGSSAKNNSPLTLGDSAYEDTSPPPGSENKFVELADDGTFTVVVKSVRSRQGRSPQTIVDVEVNGKKLYEGLDFERAFYDLYPQGRLPTVFIQNVQFYDFKARVLQKN